MPEIVLFWINDAIFWIRPIIKIIKKKSDAKLIFVSTTYVPEKELGRFQEDVNKYNEVAKKIMKENNILIWSW